METKRFNAIVEERINKIRATLQAKANEYARGDRLSNFKKAACLLNSTPEKALAGMVAKHIIALLDFIRDLDGDLLQDYTRWDEKIGDIIAYMILLDALIQER
jgi:hypothetical protein